MSWQLEKTLKSILDWTSDSLSLDMLKFHHFFCLTVTVLILHDRLLQAGVWGDTLETLVLLFFRWETSCSLCKPERSSVSDIFQTSRQTFFSPLPHTWSLPVWSSNTAPIELVNMHQISLLWLAGLISCNYKREETGVRGRSLLSLALWTNPDSVGQYLPRSWVCVCVFMCIRARMTECMCLCVGACVCKWAAVSKRSWCLSVKDVFISTYLWCSR